MTDYKPGTKALVTVKAERSIDGTAWHAPSVLYALDGQVVRVEPLPDPDTEVIDLLAAILHFTITRGGIWDLATDKQKARRRRDARAYLPQIKAALGVTE